MTQPTKGSKRKRFTPFGVISLLFGLALFAYFVRKAGVGQILDGIQHLSAGFLLVIGISALRYVVRSIAWMMCMEGPVRLRFGDAFRARVMGDAIGNILPFAGSIVSEPAKPALIRDRVPLLPGFSALAVENIFYGISVVLFIFCGALSLLLTFDIAKWRGMQILVYLTIGVVPAVLLIIYVFLRRQYPFISAGLGYLHRRGLSKRWLENGRALEERVYGFYQRSSPRFIVILLLEAGFHLVGVLEIYVTLSFISFGQPPTFFTAFILESVNRVITLGFKFIPLRLGIDEAGTGKAASVLQFTVATGVTLAIIRKARDIFWTAVGLILLLQRGWSLRRAAEVAEDAMEEVSDTTAIGVESS